MTVKTDAAVLSLLEVLGYHGEWYETGEHELEALESANSLLYAEIQRSCRRHWIFLSQRIKRLESSQPKVVNSSGAL